jgi:hypothetical protein
VNPQGTDDGIQRRRYLFGLASHRRESENGKLAVIPGFHFASRDIESIAQAVQNRTHYLPLIL